MLEGFAKIDLGENTSTKTCPVCGEGSLIRFSSYNIKACQDCKVYFEWKLSEGQEPLV